MLGAAPGIGMLELVSSVALVLAVVAGMVWLRRACAARRWAAMLNAFADREIARAARGKAPKRDRHLVYVRYSAPTRLEPSYGPSPL